MERDHHEDSAVTPIPTLNQKRQWEDHLLLVRIRQPVGRPLRTWCGELVAEGRWWLTQSQTLGVVAHVHLFPVEDHLQLLREGRVETHPRHKGWKRRGRENTYQNANKKESTPSPRVIY